MTYRVLVLPVLLVALFAIVWSPPGEYSSRPDTDIATPRPERLPTPTELAEAHSAYKALGGGFAKDESRGKVYYRFFAPHPHTAESLAKLPDIPFDYTLELTIGPDTPPGTLRTLAQFGNLRRVKISLDHRAMSERRRSDHNFNITPFIAELAAIPNLEFLDVYPISDPLLTDELAAVLPSFPSLCAIAGKGPITDAGLAHLARCPKLESISLHSCKSITDEGLAHLATMPTLRNLVLQACPQPTTAGIHHFTKKPRLIGLAIGGRDMKEDALAEVEKITTLEWLNLLTFGRGVLTDRTLAHVAKLPRLRELHLSWSTQYTDVGLRSLSAAPALEDLALLGCTNVTDDGFHELVRIKTLRYLHLVGTDQMTDTGLTELGHLPKLHSVYISSAPRVTDKGAIAFVEQRRGEITTLHISSAAVTDKFVAGLPKRYPTSELWVCTSVKQ